MVSEIGEGENRRGSDTEPREKRTDGEVTGRVQLCVPGNGELEPSSRKQLPYHPAVTGGRSRIARTEPRTRAFGVELEPSQGQAFHWTPLDAHGS